MNFNRFHVYEMRDYEKKRSRRRNFKYKNVFIFKNIKNDVKENKKIENVKLSNLKLKLKFARKTSLQNNIKLITFEMIFQIAFEKLLKLNLNQTSYVFIFN